MSSSGCSRRSSAAEFSPQGADHPQGRILMYNCLRRSAILPRMATHRLSTVIPSPGHSPRRRCAQPCPQYLWKTFALIPIAPISTPRSVRRISGEAGDEAALPRGLHGAGVVVRSDVVHGLAYGQTVKNGDAGEGSPGPAKAAHARDLDALRRRPLPRLGERFPRGGLVSWQPEVRPGDPPVLPGHAAHRAAHHVKAELRVGPAGIRPAQATPPDQPPRGQLHNAARARFPGTRPEHHVPVLLPLPSDTTQVSRVLRGAGPGWARPSGVSW